MKKILPILIPVIALLAWIAWRWAGDRAAAEAAPISWKGPPPNLSVGDPAAVFKRAFWRVPSPEDEIVHAGRHEWSDEGGVTKWAWFIEVKASPGLVKYLREENAFGLIPAASAQLPEERPGWFRFDPSEVSVLKFPHGRLQLIFSTKNNTLLASDSGAGFQRGAPEPVPAGTSANAPAPGRLPNTAPPNPKP